MHSGCSANIYVLSSEFSVSKMQKNVLWPFMSLILYTIDVIFNQLQYFFPLDYSSFVGMGSRGGRASFHICALSLTSFFLLPHVYSCWPSRATLAIVFPGSGKIPLPWASELKYCSLASGLRQGWLGKAGPWGWGAGTLEKVVGIQTMIGTLSFYLIKPPCCLLAALITVTKSFVSVYSPVSPNKNKSKLFNLCVWLYSPDFAICCLELYFR